MHDPRSAAAPAPGRVPSGADRCQHATRRVRESRAAHGRAARRARLRPSRAGVLAVHVSSWPSCAACSIAESIPYLYLDGKTRDRQTLVEQFQDPSGPPLFLISLKAGGLGLNLTAADYIFLLDPWWNPAVEAQAIDRAHRIGQPEAGRRLPPHRPRHRRGEDPRTAGEEARAGRVDHLRRQQRSAPAGGGGSGDVAGVRCNL